MDDVHPSMQRLLAAAIVASKDWPVPVTDFGGVGFHLGKSSAVITNWKTRGVSKSGAMDAEKVFGCPARYVLEGGDASGYVAYEHAIRDGHRGRYPLAANRQPIPLDDNDLYPAIRRVRFKLSAGASGFEVDYLSNGDGAPIVFRRDWYESRGLKPDSLFAVRVAGESMEPGLYEGDTVVVNTADVTPKDGVTFAVNYEGELVIKRLVRDAGQWWLSSDNPDQRRFPRKACDDACVLLGRIVHKQSEHI